uniref:Immunoglobulin I-set domain-containing protein n=1 Tax=Oreochromis niloticus TaxID=8128 RepID=A0A669CK55_ORENI
LRTNLLISFSMLKMMLTGASSPHTGTQFIVNSASVSDSGKYHCTAKNEIGIGESEVSTPVLVEVCARWVLFVFLCYLLTNLSLH